MPKARTDRDDLIRNVERQIMQRTWGRIHWLRVEMAEDRLIVHGRTPSYYTKQLALLAALDAVGSTDASKVELDIQVDGGRSHRLIAMPKPAPTAS